MKELFEKILKLTEEVFKLKLENEILKTELKYEREGKIHTQWKPNEEQLTALRRVKNAIGGEGEIYNPLNQLYEDLIKL